MDVILIGEKTTGKNVGMEYEEYTVRITHIVLFLSPSKAITPKDSGSMKKDLNPIY